MSTIRKRNILDSEPNVEPIALDFDPQVDRIDTDKHLPLYLLNRPDEPNVVKIGTGRKSRINGMLAQEALANVSYSSRFTKGFAWRKALIVPRRFRGREFTDGSLIDALDKRFGIPKADPDVYGSKEVRAVSLEEAYTAIRKYFGEGELTSITDDGGYHHFQRESGRKIKNEVNGVVKEMQSKSPRAAPPTVNSLAYLAPRFGKTRTFLRLIKQLWKKHGYGAAFISPYWLSVHNGFIEAIAKYKQFRDFVFIDARPGEQEDWEDQLEKIYKSDDKFPVVGLSLCKGDEGRGDIQKVTYVPKDERITIIDEADYGAHTDGSQDLIEYIEETEHAYSWGPKKGNSVPVHIYTTGSGFDRLAKYNKDWDTIDSVPYLTLVNWKHKDKDYNLGHIVEPHFLRWNGGKTLADELRGKFDQENIPTLYQLAAKADENSHIWKRIWKLVLSDNPTGDFNPPSPLNIRNAAKDCLRNYDKSSDDGLGVMAVLPTPNELEEGERDSAKKKLLAIKNAADAVLDDWVVTMLCGDIHQEGPSGNIEKIWDGVSNEDAEDEVKRVMKERYDPNKHKGVLVLTQGVAFRSFTVPDISVVANFTDGGRAGRAMQAASRGLSYGDRNLLGGGSDNEKKDGLFIDFGFDQSKEIGAVSKILAMQLHAEQQSERANDETRRETARRIFPAANVMGWTEEVRGELGEIEYSDLLRDVTRTNDFKGKLDQQADLRPLEDNDEMKDRFYRGNRSDPSSTTKRNKNIKGGSAGTGGSGSGGSSGSKDLSPEELIETYNRVAFAIPVYAPECDNVYDALNEIANDEELRTEFGQISGVSPEDYAEFVKNGVLDEDGIDTICATRETATDSEIHDILEINKLYEIPEDMTENMADSLRQQIFKSPRSSHRKDNGGGLNVCVIDAAGPHLVRALKNLDAVENVTVLTRLHLAKQYIEQNTDGVNVDVVRGDSELEAYEQAFNNKYSDMEFDVVAGNPPYQEDTGGHGKQARPIYDDFTDMAYDVSNQYVLMVTKSRWFGKDRFGLRDFRNRQTSRNIVKLKHWPSEEQPFDEQIKGGVSYFLIDKNADADKTDYNGYKVDLTSLEFIPEFPEYAYLVSKIFETYDGDYLDEIYIPRSRSGIKTNDPAFQDENDEELVPCYVSESKGSMKYIDPNNDEGGIGYHKVVTQADPSDLRDWGDMIISTPNETFSFTYHAFQTESKKQSQNLAKYLQLDIPRFMLMMRKNSHHINGNTIKVIPLLDVNREWSNDEVYKQLGMKDEKDAIQEALNQITKG